MVLFILQFPNQVYIMKFRANNWHPRTKEKMQVSLLFAKQKL